MLQDEKTKEIVRLLDSDTDFNVVGVSQGSVLLQFLIIFWLGYVIRTSIYLMKENIVTQKRRQEANDVPQKQSWTQSMHMIQRYSQKENIRFIQS